MKKKKLFNTSEYKTITELQEALYGTGYSVYPEIQVNNVLSFEDDDPLTKKDKKTLNTASFDFVVYNAENIPEFAVEFDGPCHSAYQKKRDSDFRKNKLCCIARLPLLRIDDSFLTKYEGLSFLKFVTERFLAWQTEIPVISNEIEERLSYSYNKEIDYDDPSNDPTFVFDLNHPFPSSVELAARLYNDNRIVTNYLNDASYFDATSKYPYIEFRREGFGGWPVGYDNRMVERRYRLEKCYIDNTGKYATENIHELTVHVCYNWRLPTSDNSDFFISFSQGIQGTSMNEIADNLCDYLALKKIEKWAQNNSITFVKTQSAHNN